MKIELNAYNKIKKRAFITLEIIAIAMFTLAVTSMITSMIINNYRKSEVYHIDEDVRSIPLEYEEAIISAEVFINDNKEIKDIIKSKIINDSIGDAVPTFYYTYKYDKNALISILMKENFIRLEETKLKTIKKVNLKAKVIMEDNEEKIILVPQYYKTDFMNM